MTNYNKVILAGNLTRDPETRHTQGGTSVTKFGLAINRKWTQNGQTKESTCFVDCVAFGRQGEVISGFLQKGSPALVEGRLEFSTWEDKQGNKRSKLEVAVEQFQFIGKADKTEKVKLSHYGVEGKSTRSRSERDIDSDEPSDGYIPF